MDLFLGSIETAISVIEIAADIACKIAALILIWTGGAVADIHKNDKHDFEYLMGFVLIGLGIIILQGKLGD